MYWVLGILTVVYLLSVIAVLIQISLLSKTNVKWLVAVTAFTPILNTLFVWSFLKIYYEGLFRKI